MNLICNKNNPFLGGFIAAECVKLNKNIDLKIEWGDQTAVKKNNELNICSTDNEFLRFIARNYDNEGLYGKGALERTEVDNWLTFSIGPLGSKSQFNNALNKLNTHLGPVTYLCNKRFTIADISVFTVLYSSATWRDILNKKSAPLNVLRWYTFISSLECVAKTIENLPKDVVVGLSSSKSSQNQTSGRAQEGKFVELSGAEMGKVVVRFPPEASGYLHIGHAKAALLNQYYQNAFEGKLIMRFDDTNPAKENVHFEKVILEDVEMLQIKPDIFSHTSQYFDLMIEYCEKMLKDGTAYVDDTEAELMKQQREQKIESANRSNSVEKNLELWREMKKGSEIGQKCCVRAKIDMQSLNGCMRDPTIYRCKNEPHPRTGTTFKVYPTYDFACPIVDSIEGVTHTLRTMEYHDRDPQFYWFIDALGLRKPHIWEYSRLSMMNTVLSKRKLTWFVEQGLVDGWDDARMPTVRGVLRRGMTVEGLKEFIIAQGSSRSVVFMDWDKIWAFNKKVIDPIAPRYTVVDKDAVPVTVKGVKEQCLKVQKHPKNISVGEKSVWVGPRVLIDQEDANSLKEGENATFINWGNLLIKKIIRENNKVVSVEAEPNLENKDYKKTLKLTWLSETEAAEFTPTWCVYFDHIISKPLLGKDEDFKQFINKDTRKEVEVLGDPELKNLKEGDIIQIQRRGFFRVDKAYEPRSLHTCKEQPVVLFYIPDGHSKEAKTSSEAKTNTTTAKNVKSAKGEGDVGAATLNQGLSSIELNAQTSAQADLVRQLKSNKAEKSAIEVEVKKLLELKKQFQNATGQEWKAGVVANESVPVTKPSNNVTDAELNAQVTAQADRVRQLKSEKAAKNIIEEEVKKLLDLKKQYKDLTGQEWKAGSIPTAPPTNSSDKTRTAEVELNAQITAQGDKVRKLKAEKAEKAVVETEVKTLIDLKKQFKDLTGKDWAPGSNLTVSVDKTSSENANKEKSPQLDALIEKVNLQANLVRDLKSKKANKEKIDGAIKVLLDLKAEYKNLTGTDFPSATRTSNKSKDSKSPAIKETVTKQKAAKPNKPEIEDVSGKKQTRLGLEAKKEENLASWYSQVITKGELIEYYDVSGCYIYRPWSYAIWEAIKEWFDGEIKKLGVQNCYFPIFVSKAALEKEKTHIADFSPEVAWVTKSGDSEMAEPIAVRPTSETVMYPAYAKWVQSYRDLPIKLNQWNNVVRWEFKHPQPFLRTREFLWQEGHTAFAKEEEACEEVTTILDLYARVYTDLLAIPVVKGRKTEKEKFAGGAYTLTVEAYIEASGRAIQGATSHHLGQNFSKMFDIIFEDPETQEKKYVYQNSWGLTTRTIGVLIMVHSDNQGLVLPPNIASVQIVIVPCGISVNLKESERNKLQSSCDELEKELKNLGLKVQGDYRDNYSPGWKFNHWELKGVPIRVELGPKDIEKQQLIAVRRDTGDKITIKRTEVSTKLPELLKSIQSNLFAKAQKELDEHIVKITNWSDFVPNLDKKNLLLVPFCGQEDCEDKIKAESARDLEADAGAPSMGAKSLCIPLEQPAKIQATDKCIQPDCKAKPLYYTLFGRSY